MFIVSYRLEAVLIIYFIDRWLEFNMFYGVLSRLCTLFANIEEIQLKMVVFYRCFLWIYVVFSVTPLAYYYIINGVVYQSPDALTFIQSRLLGSVEPLKKAFDEVVKYSRFFLFCFPHLSYVLRYNVAKGYNWEFKNKAHTTDEKVRELIM